MKTPIYWIVTASDGDYALRTISYYRKDAIEKWMDNTKTLEWKRDSKKYGWKVSKVFIDVCPVLTRNK